MNQEVKSVNPGYRGDRWRNAVTVGAVALGMFSFGHYWATGDRYAAPAGYSAPAASANGDAKGLPAEAKLSASKAPEGTGKPLWTCSMHPQVIQDSPGVCPICHMELTPLKAGTGAGGGVTVDPVIVQNMGLRTAVVKQGPLVQSVRAVGYLEEPEPLHRDINLRVNGWIEKLYANIDGMRITQGEVLFDLYSPELAVAIDELISARRQLATAPADETNKSLLETAKRKLVQYGLPETQVEELSKLEAAPHTVPIYAPMGGHLTAKMVNEGAAVKAGELVLRLANRHRMWIEAQVYEQQMPLISDGQPVQITLVSQPGKVIEGKVLFVHPHLDPQTRTATVRIEIPNEDHSLRQGMYANVEILADTYHEAIVVPREAIIDTGRKQVAFVSTGEGRFEPRLLKLGSPGQDGTVQVLSGLKAGETVVTSGQFLLDSESRLQEAIAKFGSGEGQASATSAVPAKPEMEEGPAPMAVPHTDEMVVEYLKLWKQLGARQQGDTPVDPTPLIKAATLSATHAPADAKALVKKLEDAADEMRDKPIVEQRVAFLKVSAAAIDLVKHSRPSPAVGPTLYLIHCPMAFSEQGADWIQDTDKIANPFYATEMKKCGSVTETLTTSK